MKLNGIQIKIDRETAIPIMSQKNTIYLIAKPIESYEPFDALCPMPKPLKGGEPGKERPLTNTPAYRQAMKERGEKFADWVNVVSLVELADQAGERFPMEWETVDLANIETYKNWKDELKNNNNFSEGDIQRIEMDILRCNSMDGEMIERAKDHFLAITAEVPAE